MSTLSPHDTLPLPIACYARSSRRYPLPNTSLAPGNPVRMEHSTDRAKRIATLSLQDREGTRCGHELTQLHRPSWFQNLADKHFLAGQQHREVMRRKLGLTALPSPLIRLSIRAAIGLDWLSFGGSHRQKAKQVVVRAP